MTIGQYLPHQQCEATEKCSVNAGDNNSWTFLHFAYTYTPPVPPPQAYAEHSKVPVANYGYHYQHCCQ